MLEVNKKKVFKNHKWSRVNLIVIILVPLFGVVNLLSVLDIVPRYGLTQAMDLQNGIVGFFVCVVLGVMSVMFLKKIFKGLNQIVQNGEAITAVITGNRRYKNEIVVKYTFEFEGIREDHRVMLVRRFNSKKIYAKDNNLEIYAIRNKKGQVKSTLKLYV